MNHNEIVSTLNEYSYHNSHVKALFAIGSYARNDLEPYSDLDLVMLSDEDPKLLFSGMEEKIGREIHFILTEGPTKRVYLLGDNLLKLDLIVAQRPDEVKALYLGSRITKSTDSVILDKTGILSMILQKWTDESLGENIVSLINSEVEKFLISFEAASSTARREDVFQSYFHYNLSLTRYIRLLQLQMDDTSFLYCPKRIMNRLPSYQNTRIERLEGTLRLYDLRKTLEQLATEFRETHSRLYWTHSGITRTPKEVDSFMREVLDRDLLWNFRDIAWTCPDILNEGRLYRSSALSRFEDTDALRKAIKVNGIQRIIDLRLPWEIDRHPYRNTETEIVTVPMTIRPEKDRKIFHGNWPNHVLLVDNDSEIQRVFTLLSDGIPTAIHCHAGRDRTGIVITLVMLVAGVPLQYVKKDFLSSKMGLKAMEFERFIEAVNSHGGIEGILTRFGVDNETLEIVRKWLRRDE